MSTHDRILAGEVVRFLLRQIEKLTAEYEQRLVRAATVGITTDDELLAVASPLSEIAAKAQVLYQFTIQGSATSAQLVQDSDEFLVKVAAMYSSQLDTARDEVEKLQIKLLSEAESLESRTLDPVLSDWKA